MFSNIFKRSQSLSIISLTGMLGLISILLLSGCTSEKRPDGFPKIHPLDIRILQKGQPVEGVTVSLFSKGEKIPWTTGGKTNASGDAIIMTHGKYRGIPSGTYSVVLSKTETDNFDELLKGTDETKRTPNVNVTKSFNTYSLIDLKYTKEKTTPLELKIENKGMSQSFDIGDPVKIQISTYTPGSM